MIHMVWTIPYRAVQASISDFPLFFPIISHAIPSAKYKFNLILQLLKTPVSRGCRKGEICAPLNLHPFGFLLKHIFLAVFSISRSHVKLPIISMYANNNR